MSIARIPTFFAISISLWFWKQLQQQKKEKEEEKNQRKQEQQQIEICVAMLSFLLVWCVELVVVYRERQTSKVGDEERNGETHMNVLLVIYRQKNLMEIRN